ncbi:hypothetical protein DESC_700115 [Desulfosarcina cetonica]|nr:hypothetical protein DESC_700115 [Desulfosarcina cetonica]
MSLLSEKGKKAAEGTDGAARAAIG